jgi:hypothetical protein
MLQRAYWLSNSRNESRSQHSTHSSLEHTQERNKQLTPHTLGLRPRVGCHVIKEQVGLVGLRRLLKGPDRAAADTSPTVVLINLE